MKHSIIIVAYKAADKLIKCLESLVNNPPESGPRTHKADAEIILIDNSPERIEDQINNDLLVKLLQTYVQVISEWHPENLGFAEACNLGVSKSSGENIVLMNPDTEVFPEWSERMLAHMKPGVGAVGPISNFVAGFQNFYYHMKPADTWAKVAKYAIKGMHRRGMDTKLLIGFFMMIPRDNWDKVGGMDPQFFLGCDDLDLSMRLREAGFILVIATDVFVYHEGHASFYAAGSKSLELNKQSEKLMLAKLQAKYGDKIPTSTELWGCEILPTYIPKRQTLSVCMIVRDEERNVLGPLLDMRGFADEFVVVDTGSKDKTADILMDYCRPNMNQPKKIFRFACEWEDSFAAARNFALSKCTGDWVLWLDADDRVSPESAQLIRAALDNPGPMTQAKTCHFGMILRDDGPDGFNFAEGQPRLFPRVPGLEWEGRVHESYMDAADRLGIVKVDTNIIIDHTGYKDPAVMLKKHARNLRLMKLEPASPKKFYHMGKNLMALGQFKEAEECFSEVLEREWGEPIQNPFKDQVRTCMACLIMAAKGADESIDPYLEDNGKPDAIMLRGEVAFKRGDIFKAEALYNEYLALGPIQDPHGSQQEYFRRVAGERLQVIADARKKVFGEVPA